MWNVFGLTSFDPLSQFSEMWYQIFLWSLISSIVVHVFAALFAFITLRKHQFGKFFSIFILLMGIISPITSGVVSSAVIAFVHRTSCLQMSPIYAMFWGVGQTVVSICVGFTRILATL